MSKLFGGGSKGDGGVAAQMAEDRRLSEARLAQEREDARVRQAKLDQQEADRVNNRTTAIGNGRANATNQLMTAFGNRGVDANEYRGFIDNAVSNRATTLSDNTDPASYFGDDFVNDVLAQRRDLDRGNFGRQVNAAFAPNFEVGAFGDTADDGFIDSVLNTQRTAAVGTLDRAKARGQLNDAGYDSALERIGQQATAGRATAQQLGSSVLQDYRGQLRGVGDEARAAAGNYDIGGTFDLGGYTSRADSLRNDLTSNLEGGINSALAGQEFFDVGDILTRGGSTQGVANPTPAGLDAQAERDRLRNTNRGIGGGGTF